MNSIYIIIGYPGHGKTEVGLAIAEHLNLKRGSTSDAVYEALSDSRALRNGTTPAHELSILRSIPKSELRDELVKCGDHLCAAGGSTCIVWHLVTHGCGVIDGVRRGEELWSARHRLVDQGLHPVVWWVERVPTPPRIHDNTTVTCSDSDFVFVNDCGTIEELRHKVVRSL
jgi:hypothetical protein